MEQQLINSLRDQILTFERQQASIELAHEEGISLKDFSYCMVCDKLHPRSLIQKCTCGVRVYPARVRDEMLDDDDVFPNARPFAPSMQDLEDRNDDTSLEICEHCVWHLVNKSQVSSVIPMPHQLEIFDGKLKCGLCLHIFGYSRKTARINARLSLGDEE